MMLQHDGAGYCVSSCHASSVSSGVNTAVSAAQVGCALLCL